MKTLDRYILRGFIVNYAIALLVMVGLYLVIDLFFNFDEFTKEAGGALEVIRRIVDYYSYNMLVYFAQLSGVITVVAACCTFAGSDMRNSSASVVSMSIAGAFSFSAFTNRFRASALARLQVSLWTN